MDVDASPMDALFDHEDVGTSVIALLSLRSLWISRRVSKQLHRLCTQVLSTMPRPVLGGQDMLGDGKSSQFVEYLDPTSMRFRPMPVLPKRRIDAAMVGLESGQLVVAGGLDWDASRASKWEQTRDVVVLDPAMKVWSQLPVCGHERSDARMVALHDGTILLMGGTIVGGGPQSEDLDLSCVESFVNGASSWGAVKQMTQGEILACATCAQQCIYRQYANARCIRHKSSKLSVNAPTGVFFQRAQPLPRPSSRTAMSLSLAEWWTMVWVTARWSGLRYLTLL